MSFASVVQEIQAMTVEERKRLIHIIVDSLTDVASLEKSHSLLELDGLGKEIWQDMDAQSYVNELRSEFEKSRGGVS